MVRQTFPGSVIPVGCIDTVFGYLPTAAMVGQRGYEDSGFFEPFGFGKGGQFRPEVERLLGEGWSRLAR